MDTQGSKPSFKNAWNGQGIGIICLIGYYKPKKLATYEEASVSF